MALRKIPGVRQVSVREIRELLKQPWVRDDALSTRMSEARVLPDGRVLLYLGEGEKGTIFPSRAEVEEVLQAGRELVAGGNTVNLTLTLLPPVADFLRDVEAHAASLGARIRAPAEALDGTEASLGAVDLALRRIPIVKRMTREVVTPLVAYVGQVMLAVCGGHWTKAPTTRKVRVPRYDPAELAAYEATAQATRVEADQAAADVRARRGAPGAQAMAFNAVMGRLITCAPRPIKEDWIDEPVSGNENEPMITARDGRLLQPFGLVVIPMVEPSKRLPLRAAVDVTIMTYRAGYKPGPAGTLLNPIAPVAPARKG
jgi:hypothetical protein